jgi:hypothetical protein
MDQPPFVPPSFPPYSPFADWLSKFHMASEPIQALWILALTLMVLAICWSLTAPLRLWLTRRERSVPQGELVLGVFREPNGRLVVHGDGHARAPDHASAARFAERQLTLPER